MVVTAIAIMYFTHRDVGRAVLGAEKASAHNVLRLVELNIQGGYNKLLADKIDMIVGATQNLKNATSVYSSILESNRALVNKEQLSAKEAQERSLEWIRTVPFANAELFVINRLGSILAHPDPRIEGTSIALMEDIKGRPISEIVGKEDQNRSGDDFAVFFWEDPSKGKGRKKMGHFETFSPWQWTVGALADFGEIEAQHHAKVEKILDVLHANFSQIRIAESGGAFLFNGKGKMLIPPRDGLDKDYLSVTNEATNRPILDDLMQAARNPDQSILYRVASTDGNQLMEAHVKLFKALDWYIVVAVPVEEINQPAKALVLRQSLIIAMIFLVCLVVAYFLVSRISRPLNTLAKYAKDLPNNNFLEEEDDSSPLENLPKRFKDEVNNLGEAFVLMRTQLKKNIKSLLDAETKFRTILGTVKEGVFETDLQGRLTLFNDSVCKILGHPRFDLLGKDIKTFMTPKSSEKIRDVSKTVYKTGEFGELWDCEIIQDDGGISVVEISVYLIKDRNGKQAGFRGIVRDVSERLKAEKDKKRLEAQLLQAQKMEAIGTLAGGIAHDFNNVLSAIMGYTDLVLEDCQPGSQTQSNLNEVIKAGTRARELIQQILTFSRQTEQELKPAKITPIVKESLKFLRASTPATIEIRQDIQAKEDIVLCDPTKIHQVLMNLCTNAIYALMNEKGGTLEVTMQNLFLQSEDNVKDLDLAPGNYLRLTVSDTGDGMDSTTLKRIFDPYYTTKEKGKGTGLGLSIALGIVKSHNGTITVYSEPGKGTTFNIYFPCNEQKANPEQSIEPDPIPYGNEKVLFVDDEKSLVKMGKQMLERLGYDVITKTSSQEALDDFRTRPHHFDLVITDLTMPKMTGVELARVITKIRSDIPIILCTGFSEKMTKEMGLEVGICEIVMKPIVKGIFTKTIRKVLDNRGDRFSNEVDRWPSKSAA